jgi:hypothetical protein
MSLAPRPIILVVDDLKPNRQPTCSRRWLRDSLAAVDDLIEDRPRHSL